MQHQRIVRRVTWGAFALTFSSALVLTSASIAQTKHLDAAVRRAILSERFRTVVRVSGIPRAVMAAAADARRPHSDPYTFELADPGAPFQSTDVLVTPALPGRRLVAAFASDNYWILHYEAGGIAHTYQVAVFALRGDRVRFVWHAQVRAKFTSIDELRKLICNGNAASLDDSYTQLY